MRQLLSIILIAGLVALVAARPWHQLNRAAGITTTMDVLRADSVQHVEQDSLIIDPVAVTLPPTYSDSLNYRVHALTKNNEYLKDQEAYYSAENKKLEAKVKAKRQRLQDNIVTLNDLDALLAKQNAKAAKAEHLKESPLEEELNRRKNTKDGSHFKNP